MDPLEKLISLCIAMLMLSLVVEKLSNFWKLHGSDSIRLKAQSPEAEKTRERIIQRGTLITGILVALLFKADALQLLKTSEPSQVIGWELVFHPPDAVASAGQLALVMEQSTRSDTTLASSNAQVSKILNEEPISASTRAYYVSLHIPKGNWLTWLSVGLLLLSFVAFFAGVWFRGDFHDYQITALKETYRNFFWGAGICALVSLLLAIAIGSLHFLIAYFFLMTGIALTGGGISFGSKFWHDLLDVLFSVKRISEKATDAETYRQPSAQAVMDHIELSAHEIALRALTEHKSEIMSIDNVVSVGVGHTQEREYCIEVGTEGILAKPLPDSFYISLPNGMVRPVPVCVQDYGKVEALLSIESSSLIMHAMRKGNSGAAGCFVKKPGQDEVYLLTCFHVVLPPDWPVSTPYSKLSNGGSHEIQMTPSGEKIGELQEGIRNVWLDAAIIKLESPDNKMPVSDMLAMESPTRVYQVTANAIKNTDAVLLGSVSGRRVGVVTSVNHSVCISYPEDKWELQDLFSIQSYDGRPFSKKGDSGSLVVTPKGDILGIVVAGNAKRTYAIPISRILARFNLELYMSGKA